MNTDGRRMRRHRPKRLNLSVKPEPISRREELQEGAAEPGWVEAGDPPQDAGPTQARRAVERCNGIVRPGQPAHRQAQPWQGRTRKPGNRNLRRNIRPNRAVDTILAPRPAPKRPAAGRIGGNPIGDQSGARAMHRAACELYQTPASAEGKLCLIPAFPVCWHAWLAR